MNNNSRSAFIVSQAACMNARLAAMQHQHLLDKEAGRPLTHQPEDFDSLPDQFGLGHNAVLTYLQGE